MMVEYWDTFGEELPPPLDYGFSDIAALFESTGMFKVTDDTVKFDYAEFFAVPEKTEKVGGFYDDDDDDEGMDEFDGESYGSAYSGNDGEEESGEMSDNEDSDEDRKGLAKDEENNDFFASNKNFYN